MRYIQHQLLALSSLLDLKQHPLIITITPNFMYQVITPNLTKNFYEHESYVYLLEQIQEGIFETMREKGINSEDLYREMKKIKVLKEEVKLY